MITNDDQKNGEGRGEPQKHFRINVETDDEQNVSPSGRGYRLTPGIFVKS